MSYANFFGAKTFCNWISLMGHPCDRVPITLQIGGGEPITIEN